MVEATATGRAALREVHKLAIEPISEALDSLTEAERRKLSGGLEILRQAFAETPRE